MATLTGSAQPALSSPVQSAQQAGLGQGPAAASGDAPLEPDYQHFLTTFLRQPTVPAAAAAAGALPEGMPFLQNVQQVPLPSVAIDVAAPGRTGAWGLGPAIASSSTPTSGLGRGGPQSPATPSGMARRTEPEPARSALRDEYWFLAGKLQEQQSLLLSNIQQLDRFVRQAAGGAHKAKASRSRRILAEAHKRCTAEPGSAAAASYPITDATGKGAPGMFVPKNSVKGMRAVLASLKRSANQAAGGAPAGAATAAAAPVIRAAAGVTEGAEPPPIFTCPISQDVMHDPVVAADGHTYERRLIEEWMRRGQQQGPPGAAGAGGGGPAPRSPMANQPLPHTALVPNLALRSAIREWQEAQRRQRQERQQQEGMQRRGSRPLT
ncbi:hypothetical protein HYH02_010730 [Chlamydomonas schloesseri]|uniref:U-box domain-containing protein n=1 Tax=Chlamydomonas schloesseri TaxID=2026947 RepID=A0A835T4T2_9CHLO|nr:hypothetical protein HYH02_010730 [Chlamydomonas schloesseri]|eukprot:KAG2438937.1 hypothetical protein HYH02_010730 [Chlamydomonas schloesseri]